MKEYVPLCYLCVIFRSILASLWYSNGGGVVAIWSRPLSFPHIEASSGFLLHNYLFSNGLSV